MQRAATAALLMKPLLEGIGLLLKLLDHGRLHLLLKQMVLFRLPKLYKVENGRGQTQKRKHTQGDRRQKNVRSEDGNENSAILALSSFCRSSSAPYSWTMGTRTLSLSCLKWRKLMRALRM